MKKNVGSIDKALRVIIAVIAAYLAYDGRFGDTVSYILYAVAIVMLFTTLMGFCPLYTVFGMNTCKKEEK